MNWKPAPLFILAFVFLDGCGGGSGGGGTTPPPPPPAIAVTFAASGTPPNSLAAGGTASITANVANDSANAGVKWSCTPSNACGSFNPTSTSSGAATTYTAPATGGTVTIIATSVTDGTKTAQANVTINAPAITVTLSTSLPLVLATSTTATVAATTNDSAGVNWSCTPAGTCGSFNPAKTLTGVTTTYTAPSAAPTGDTVTITATSVTDTTKFATSSAIVITGTATLGMLKGQYAFLVRAPTGVPSLRGITTWAGSVTLDGNGSVTGGVEDLICPSDNDQADPILASTATGSSSGYTVDSTGHGRLIMSTMKGETLGISFVLTSPSHAEIIEADGNGGVGGDPGSGTMDLQTLTTPISGAYSFTMEGIDVGATTLLSMGGSFTVTSPSSITGTIDVNSAGSFSSAAFTTGSVATAPDTNGRGQLNFVPTNLSTPASQVRTFIFYMVSSRVLRLFENDGLSYLGGTAYFEGASTTLSGNYVYQHSGWTSTGRSVAAGQFTVPAASTTISGGVSDSNVGAAPPTTVTTAAAVSGSFAASTTETGTIDLTLADAAGSSTLIAYPVDPSVNILDPNNTTGTGGALLLHTDSKINGTGILLPQGTPKAFLANYALNLTNSIATTTPNEVDLVGVLAADGTSSFGTTNFADYDEDSNSTANPMIGAALAGTFAADTTHAGRYTGSFTVTAPTTAASPYSFIPSAAFSVALYPTGNSQAFIVETDTQANIMGRILPQQLP